MTKKKNTVLTLVIIIIAALAVGFYTYMVDGALIKRAYMSSQGAIDYFSKNGQELVFDYEAEGIRIFLVNDEGAPRLYTLKKKFGWWALGFWTFDYPSYSNIQAITTIDDDVYICNLGKPDLTMFLQTEDGGRIDPVIAQSISVTPDQYVINVFKITNYVARPGDYKIMVEDETGAVLNPRTDELEIDEINISLLTRDDSKLLTYSAEEVASLGDDRSQVIDVLIDTIAKKTEIAPMGFEGSKLPMTQKDISTSTFLGNYYTVRGKDSVYGWVHKVSYQLTLNGDYYKNTLTRHESTPPLGASKVTFYRVDSSEALNEIYDLFYPEAKEPPQQEKTK